MEPEKHSKKWSETGNKVPETKTGQFVCFQIIELESINRQYILNGKTTYKRYQNIKLFFHSWYRKGSKRTFIIASDEMTLTGVEIYNFICAWQGAPLNRDAIDKLTVEQLKGLAIGYNAIIDYSVGAGPTQINKISPPPTDKRIIPIKGLEIPRHLINREIQQSASAGFGGLVDNP